MMKMPVDVENKSREIVKRLRMKNQWSGQELKTEIYGVLGVDVNLEFINQSQYNQDIIETVERLILDNQRWVKEERGYKGLKKSIRLLLRKIFKTDEQASKAVDGDLRGELL